MMVNITQSNALRNYIQFSSNNLFLKISYLSTRLKSNESLDKRQENLMSRGLPKQKPINGVKDIVIVASGKGGVGKSTIAVNLAVKLKLLHPEKEIGLLDADVFGPSIPLMMNLHETPLLTDDNKMKPLMNYGVKCMSIGNLVTEKSALIWRGLMVMNALDKLLRNVDWNPLDCLIIDTPPGTGDTHLSLVQNLPITGTLLVTTSQKTALQVAQRGLVMFQKLHVPVIGLVYNMSSIICSNCHKSTSLFGDYIHEFSKINGISILQDIPMDGTITEGCDTGKPVVISHPNSPQAEAFEHLANQLITFLNKKT